MGEPPTDQDLISLSLRDGEAFLGVFERHYDPVRRYLQRRAGREVGEELAAETFELAFARRSSFDPRFSSARPWLFGIATNVLRHHLRSERAGRFALSRFLLLRDARIDPGPDDQLLAVSVSARLKEALGSLSVADRDVLLLYAIGELSYEEIAVALGIPTGTVRSRLHRARRQVKAHLALEDVATTMADRSLEVPRSRDGRA